MVCVKAQFGSNEYVMNYEDYAMFHDAITPDTLEAYIGADYLEFDPMNEGFDFEKEGVLNV
jgi:hypothetical protein